MNISSNILGLGNAATPFGIKAANLLDKKNDINASRSLAAFVVLNTSSIQLIPSTIIALREANGAAVPFDILPAVIIIQIAAAACGIFFTYLLFNKNK
jgi:spore maturation protein A